MKGNISVKKKVVYAEEVANLHEREADVIYEKNGQLSKPDMVNRDIEKPEHREKIPEGQGDISITIQIGEELGEISFNVQFEGRRGDYDFCINQHNDLLLHVNEWIADLYGELAAEFEARIESDPCPITERRVAVALASEVLQQAKTLNQARREYVQEVSTEVTKTKVEKKADIKRSR